MCSESIEEQASLPLDVVAVEKPRGRRGPGPRVGSGLLLHRLDDDALAVRGWPCGTEVLVDLGRRPCRGEMVLARDGGRLRVGILTPAHGRPALRAGQQVHWLSAHVQYLGVVVSAEPPLAGMPAPRPHP